jgi:single-stranded-DNA-specific exonuclease
MTLLPEQVEAFSKKFEEVVSSTINPELLIPEIIVDAEIHFKELRPSFYNIICQMEPFGPENLRPVFVARNVRDNGWSKIVKEQHIRFCVRQDQITFTGIGFGMAERFPLLQMNKPIDIVFTLDENEWNDQKTLQLKVIDFRLSEG